ncbi:MAG: ABC-2 transporter permease, partial [Dysosmobacter sp.]|nr:ABC-2 transporter permease [Dysosmobacter sp.]
MRGMIYKDLCLFFKGIDKVVLVVLGGLLVLLWYKSGAYAGMLFSFALDMMVGLLHLTALEKEEKTAWRSYQRTMPVGVGKVVAGKYAAVLLTAPVSVVGAVISNLAAFAVYGTFWPEVLGLSVAAAIIVPPVFAVFSLPFYYWLGNRIA